MAEECMGLKEARIVSISFQGSIVYSGEREVCILISVCVFPLTLAQKKFNIYNSEQMNELNMLMKIM